MNEWKQQQTSDQNHTELNVLHCRLTSLDQESKQLPRQIYAGGLILIFIVFLIGAHSHKPRTLNVEKLKIVQQGKKTHATFTVDEGESGLIIGDDQNRKQIILTGQRTGVWLSSGNSFAKRGNLLYTTFADKVSLFGIGKLGKETNVTLQGDSSSPIIRLGDNTEVPRLDLITNQVIDPGIALRTPSALRFGLEVLSSHTLMQLADNNWQHEFKLFVGELGASFLHKKQKKIATTCAISRPGNEWCIWDTSQTKRILLRSESKGELFLRDENGKVIYSVP